MITWGNFLHIYQPPDQAKDRLRQIVYESYLPLIKILKNNSRAKLTLNITACLSRQLKKEGYLNLLKDIQLLAQSGQLELTGSAAFHAFLPLLPKAEIERQIVLNYRINRRIIGPVYQPKGLHLPEMAYAPQIASVALKLGYRWIILNETSYQGRLFEKISSDRIYCHLKKEKLAVLFRNRWLSDLIQRGWIRRTNDFTKVVEQAVGEGEYFITAMDGETFGHHRHGLQNWLAEIYHRHNYRFSTVSEIIQCFPKSEIVSPVKSSWASMESELKKKIYYAQWKYPGNPIQCWQWQLTRLAIKTVNQAVGKRNYMVSRRLLDKGLFSCQYWWAGAAPWWEIEHIEKGAYYLLSSIRALNSSADASARAEKLYQQIVFKAFEWERTGRAHQKSMNYTNKIKRELKDEFQQFDDKTTINSQKH